MSGAQSKASGFTLVAPVPGGCEVVLTPETVKFVVALHRKFDAECKDFLTLKAYRYLV